MGYIPKGRHAYRPRCYRPAWSDPIDQSMRLTPSCTYQIGHDQSDWNKGLGLSLSLFTNHRNSAMSSWRWNGTHFEHALYVHHNSQVKVYPCEVTTRPDQWINVQLRYIEHSGAWMARINDEIIIADAPKGKTVWRVIYPWFGGSQSAPHKMKIDIK